MTLSCGSPVDRQGERAGVAAAAGADRVHDRVRNLVRGRDVRCHGLRDVVAACLQPRCAVVQLPARARPPPAPAMDAWACCRHARRSGRHDARNTDDRGRRDRQAGDRRGVRPGRRIRCVSQRCPRVERPRDGVPRAVRPGPRAGRGRRGGRPGCPPPPARRPRRRVPVGVLRPLRELRDREVVPVLHRRLRPGTGRSAADLSTTRAPFTSSWRSAASPSTCS